MFVFINELMFINPDGQYEWNFPRYLSYTVEEPCPR